MLDRRLAIPENLVEQTGADGLTCVHGNDRAPSVLMAQEVMAAFDALNAKTGLGEGGDKFRTGDTRSAAHAAMVTRWMPTNSNCCSGAPSTSRHSAMASRMRSVTSSSDRAWV